VNNEDVGALGRTSDQCVGPPARTLMRHDSKGNIDNPTYITQYR